VLLSVLALVSASPGLLRVFGIEYFPRDGIAVSALVLDYR
jgi:hypothetical protein